MYRNLFLFIPILFLGIYSGKKNPYSEGMAVSIYHGKETIAAIILKAPEKRKGKYEVHSERYGDLSINENQIKGPLFNNNFEYTTRDNMNRLNSSKSYNRLKVRRSISNSSFFGPKDNGKYLYDVWMDEISTGFLGYEFKLFLSYDDDPGKFMKLSEMPSRFQKLWDKDVLIFSGTSVGEDDEPHSMLDKSTIPGSEVKKLKSATFTFTLEVLDDDPLVLEKEVKPGLHNIEMKVKARKVGEPLVVPDKKQSPKREKKVKEEEIDQNQQSQCDEIRFEDDSSNFLNSATSTLAMADFAEEKEEHSNCAMIDGLESASSTEVVADNTEKNTEEDAEENENIPIENISVQVESDHFHDKILTEDFFSEKVKAMESQREKDFLLIERLQGEISKLKEEKQTSRYSMQKMQSRANQESQKLAKEIKELIGINRESEREMTEMKGEIARLRNQLEMEKEKNSKNQKENKMLKERILDLNLDVKKKEVPTIVEKEIIDLAGEKEEKYRSEIATLNRQIRSQKVDFTNKLKAMERERDEICDRFREREIRGNETAKQIEELEETTAQLTKSNDHLVEFNHGLNAQND